MRATPKRILFITDFYQEEMLLGVVDYARERGWELIANMRFHGMFPMETQADGLLVTGYGLRVQKWLRNWRETPMVHLGIAPPELPIPWVDVDHEATGRAGARHLMGLGQMSHAYYTLGYMPETRRIRDAFEAELKKASLKPIRLDFTEENGSFYSVSREERLEWLARRLKEQKMPLAVMTCDDRRSLELIAACEIAGLRVPEDVSILGCENRAVEVMMSPVALSSVNLNRHLAGWKAAELLDRMMSGGGPIPQSVTVPPKEVVGRASTATFVTESAGINRAVICIRSQFSRPIKLEELARVAGMSERHFRAEFVRLVGHGPREELLRVRMACAARLLRDTDLKLEAVASESGLGSAKKLCEFFGRFYGMTPHRWRMQSGKGKPSEPVASLA